MKKIIIHFFGICIVFSFCIWNVYAGTPALQRPWELTFEDGSKIFFMTPDGWFTPPDLCEKRMQIRSGLYYNTDPRVSIYYINRFFHENSVFFSGDGMNFAHIVWGTSGFFGTEARDSVFFYERGVLVNSHPAVNFVRDESNVSWTSAGMFWIRRSGVSQEEDTLRIVTVDNNEVVFDIVTGDIISQSLPPLPSRGLFPYIIVKVIVLFAVLAFVLYKRRIKPH